MESSIPPTSRAAALRALLERPPASSDAAARRRTLLDAIDGLHLTDPAESFRLADQAVANAISGHDMPAAAEAYLYRGLSRRALGQIEEARVDLADAFSIGADLDLGRVYIDAAIGLAEILESRNDVAEAIRYYAHAFQRAEEVEDVVSVALSSTGLGEIYTTIGDYTTAIKHHYAALAAHQRFGDDVGSGAALHAIGVIHGLTGDYDAALNHIGRSMALLRKGGSPALELKALTNLGAVYVARNELDSALDCELRALAAYEVLGQAENVAATQLNLASIYQRKGDISAAITFNLRALDAFPEESSPAHRCTVLLNLGGLYTITGAADDALFILREALAVAEELQEVGLQATAHERLSVACEASGDLVGALAHERRHGRLREELAGAERQRELATLQARYELERAEREREILQMRAEQLEVEVQRKQHELTSVAISLVQKNEMLEQMRSYLKQLRKGTASKTRSEVDALLRALDPQEDAGDEWARFNKQLDQVNQEFAHRLSEKHPDLSVTELKICSLASINLSSKEIAGLLNTSVRTVETHRYRIRKKLGLAGDTSFLEFLGAV
jgi:tetratricopeptide (TPR) repeat protein